MRIIGVAGTAKNTGKTTTISALLKCVSQSSKTKIGLTSIGYDGEEIDNITGLVKPRLFLKKGNVVATAITLINVGSAELKIIEETDVFTPLGRVIIAEVKKDGLVVVAGPNKSGELKRVVKAMLEELGCEIVLVDGAMNRIAPMAIADGLIIATGAARNSDVAELVQETRHICDILDLAETGESYKKIVSDIKTIAVINKGDKIDTYRYSALIHDDMVLELRKIITDNARAMYIPAAVSQPVLEKLLEILDGRLSGFTILLHDPLKLMVNASPERIVMTINKVEALKGRMEVLKKVPVLAVTINPFYPRYMFDKNIYEPAYVDEMLLKKEMQKALSLPVVNILKDGADILMKILGF
ncbi:hypothetical protein SAMN05660826_01830 [Caldanaerovirga acetigignens]|uniref:DRTGG domain-containing protein n=1 Tax=Caldanaerovirga acetigignens TaxID=447595 RepID=A0A1M7L8G4_9FIRM|nr:hypothetical protein [Caldanaerovirga acetigignens]SHM74470.1 hypothetical protein SAMN05660826_01830 [Caldanaerovirga acetigignens]